ncbi:MAG: DUF489 family protein [Gammaproteobacteria bacterium]|nr:DUF489 family protein [Gammaproteobacteria bacterium]
MSAHLLTLERSFIKSAPRLNAIRDGIIEANNRLRADDSLETEMIEVLARIYRARISLLTPRSMVRAEPAHLKRLE